MDFELSVFIHRAPSEVFAFLRDKDKYPQEPGSPVLVLEQTTPGPAGTGTRYREVVQMLPFVRGEILSEITCFEPRERLEEDFRGAGMVGHLAYEFRAENGGTRLIQRETLQMQGFFKVVSPAVKLTLEPRLLKRLEEIRTILESGRAAPSIV